MLYKDDKFIKKINGDLNIDDLNEVSFARQLLPKDKLTYRETTIAKYLLLGRSRAEIAKALFISENTVKTHVKNIYQKAEVKNQKMFMAKYLTREENNYND